ncbi:MAG: alpha/beta fold hydrolase [Clostridiales bacterium]|jgi:alpha-beta hydrolase superfamily lysophospholipase|nr:alpha/beta fold hydrolase [Clostridiales bacterium]
MKRGKQSNLSKNGNFFQIFVSGIAFREVSLKWKRYVFLAAVVLAFLYALISVGLSVYYAGRVIHWPLSPVAPIKQNLAYEYSAVSFRSREEEGSVLLRGWHFRPNKTDRAVILVHEFGGNRFPFDMDTLDLISAFAREGFNTLVFDLRNSGDAEAGMTAFGLREKADVLGAVSYMQNVGGYKNIVLFGLSTGANTAAMAAAETSPAEVGALILDSPIVDMRQFILYRVREWSPQLPDFPFRYTIPMMTEVYLNGDAARADIGTNLDACVPRPVLLIHGNNDEIVSKSDATAVYDRYLTQAVGRISIWNVPGVGHAEAFFREREEYIERITAFLRRVYPQQEAA